MEPIALTRASQLIEVTDTLERLGVSAERMLEQAKLPMWHYCDPDDLIPAHHIYALMDQATRSLGDPTFGLQVGAERDMAAQGSFGRLIASSLSIYHALETGCRLIHLHSTAGHYRLTEAGEEVWCCRSQFRGPQTGRRENEHYILMRLVKVVRMGAGPAWRPAKVCLQTREAPDHKLRNALGDPEIRIGQKFTGIAVPRQLLAQPLRRRGPPSRDGEDTERRLRLTAPAPSLVDALRQLAGTLLKEEMSPRIEFMAEITGLSVRSLQRHLAENGLSHRQLVDQARYRAATRLLKDADIRITDIAMELNYTDSANFTRAFKRWAGVTPREYRSHQQMA